MYYLDSNKTTSPFDIRFMYGRHRFLGTFNGNYYAYDATVGKPSRTGYKFDGWEITNDGGGVNFYPTPDAYADKTEEFGSTYNRPVSWAYYLYDASYAGDVTITAQWSLNNYEVTYIDMIKDTTEQLGETVTESKPYGSTVRGSERGDSTAVGAYYTGYYYVSDTSATVTTSGATVYRYFSPQNYPVTYIDRIYGTTTQLGKTVTEYKPFGSTVSGSDRGSNKADNAYYNGYYYAEDTSAIVTTDGATVYRYFKLRLIDVPVTVNWEDESNAYDSRPGKVTLLLMNGSEVAASYDLVGNNSVPTSINTWTYTFTNMQQYDTKTGNEIQYSLKEATRREDGTIKEDYVDSLNGALKYKIIPDPNNSLSVTNEAVPVEPDHKTRYGVTVSGTVTWKDENDKYHFRPDSVTVTLVQNGKATDNKIVLEEGKTDYEFTGLNFFDSNKVEYTYTVIEEHIDYYKITSIPDTIEHEETDEFGNTVKTKSYVVDFTNTFAPNADPENPPVRYADNQLNMNASYLTDKGAATDADFARLQLNKNGQVLNVTLKQLNLIWKPVNAEEGEYLETYSGYSGYDISLILTGEKVSSLNKLAYGKYEIDIANATNFNFKDITELNTKNVTFSYENGKYYVTYSYQYEEAKEDLNINMLLNDWRGYTSEQKVNNYLKP